MEAARGPGIGSMEEVIKATYKPPFAWGKKETRGFHWKGGRF